MHKQIKGVGMTAKEMIYFDTREEEKAHWRAAAAAWDAAGNSFEIEIAAIEQWAREQLAELGFKNRAAFIERKEPLGDSLPDRAGSYAARVLKYISVVRKAIVDGNAQEAARFGVCIGMAFKEILNAMEWEKPALQGNADNERIKRRYYA